MRVSRDDVAQSGIVADAGADGDGAGRSCGDGGGVRRRVAEISGEEFVGESWGMGGYFTIPYAYLTDENLADDFWVIRVVK
jgi:hypothetical protein